jgi:prepilin-type N-terminal cleavage/methylation domain-containing protein
MITVFFQKKVKRKDQGGFSFLELMISIAIVLLLSTLAIPNFRSYQNKSALTSQINELFGQISLAREKTISSDISSSWGIRVSASTSPQTITMFNGNSYPGRNPVEDIITTIDDSTIVTAVDFAGEDWVVFKRVSGQASTTGYISIRLVSDNSFQETIYLNEEGLLDSEPFVEIGSGRSTDSRHIHVLYNDPIDIVNDEIEIYIDGLVVADEVISIANNLVDGQLVWNGEIDNAGTFQKLEIRTHEINNPNTIISIHRERHFNDLSLGIHLTGDAWPRANLVFYNADGTWATGTSPSVGLISEK